MSRNDRGAFLDGRSTAFAPLGMTGVKKRSRGSPCHPEIPFSASSLLGDKYRVERLAGLEYAVGNDEQLAHHRADHDHGGLSCRS